MHIVKPSIIYWLLFGYFHVSNQQRKLMETNISLVYVELVLFGKFLLSQLATSLIQVNRPKTRLINKMLTGQCCGSE